MPQGGGVPETAVAGGVGEVHGQSSWLPGWGGGVWRDKLLESTIAGRCEAWRRSPRYVVKGTDLQVFTEPSAHDLGWERG